MMNYYLNQYQFSEDFLIKSLPYYDSTRCLKTQKHLTPEFCFTYLCDNKYDSADIWTNYDDIIYHFRNKYTKEELETIFNNI